MFREKIITKTLLKHQSWNHEIKFELKKQFTFELIYTFFTKKLKVLRKYLKKNLTKIFIKKSKSSTKYSILFTSKKNDKLRLCVDYRKLNDITIKDKTLLSNINEFQDKLIDVEWFTKLNLREAYNFIKIKIRKKWKTTFRTRYKLFEYLIILFELINASTTCQDTINDALRKHLNIFAIIYLNDILIYFKNQKEYKKHVKTILRCLNQKEFLIKLKKCEFHQQEIDFLKFKVKIKEIKIDFDKLKSMKEWSTSQNIKKYKSFWGLWITTKNSLKIFSKKHYYWLISRKKKV